MFTPSSHLVYRVEDGDSGDSGDNPRRFWPGAWRQGGDRSGDTLRFRLRLMLRLVAAHRLIEAKHGAPRKFFRRGCSASDE